MKTILTLMTALILAGCMTSIKEADSVKTTTNMTEEVVEEEAVEATIPAQ